MGKYDPDQLSFLWFSHLFNRDDVIRHSSCPLVGLVNSSSNLLEIDSYNDACQDASIIHEPCRPRAPTIGSTSQRTEFYDLPLMMRMDLRV